MLEWREWLESRQIGIYFGAVLLGGLLAWLQSGTELLAVGIDPLLALMLFVTFLQIPVMQLRQSLANRAFLGALMTVNFVAVPLLLALLLPWLPDDTLLRAGVLLVLLAPCIDYVVTFAQLGRADARALLAATPVLLAAQMAALPLLLKLLLGAPAAQLVQGAPFLKAFLLLIVLPLSLAAACQAWAARSAAGARVVAGLGLLPVPATAAVLFVVVAALTPRLGPAQEAVWAVLPVYLVYALIAPVLGWWVARIWRLPVAQRRAVAFSGATRNSLVVLPLALAMPTAMPWIAAVIVAQTLVELVSELAYVQLLARCGTR